jgi:hypothetical protein
MNILELGIESYDVKRREDTLSETWSWRVYLLSGVIFAGASSSYDEAMERIEHYALEMRG